MAIKKFKESESGALVKKTTMREVKVLRMLTETNIIEIKDVFHKKGITHLVFKYIYKNLREMLEKSLARLEHERIRSFICQLPRGSYTCTHSTSSIDTSNQRTSL
jgi:cyclin-dependent kinase-like